MEPVRIFSTRPVNFKIIAGWPVFLKKTFVQRRISTRPGFHLWYTALDSVLGITVTRVGSAHHHYFASEQHSYVGKICCFRTTALVWSACKLNLHFPQHFCNECNQLRQQELRYRLFIAAKKTWNQVNIQEWENQENVAVAAITI